MPDDAVVAPDVGEHGHRPIVKRAVVDHNGTVLLETGDEGTSVVVTLFTLILSDAVITFLFKVAGL